MISLIDRNRATVEEGILCGDTLQSIENAIQTDQKVLIYLNRRWAYRAVVCQDCSHAWKCPHCDVAMTLHTSPKTQLLCHHCHKTEPMPETCPKCASSHITGVGLALQSVESFIAKRFPLAKVCRIDSDKKEVSAAQIYLSTEYALRHLAEPIGIAIILLPEAELNIPEFDIEERLYDNIRALSNTSEHCIIETHAPSLPVLQDCLHGNYRDFLIRMLAERKRFHYPPYSGLAYIRIKHKNVGILEDLGAKIQNKLGLGSQNDDDHILYDRSIRMKRAGEFIDTILVRSDNLDEILEPIQLEVLKNRAVELEIRGRKIL